MSTQSPTVLAQILTQTREELERRKRAAPAFADAPRATDGARRLHDALAGPGVGVIAEFKRRSPSAGVLREEPDVRDFARAYERAGAVAMSVLTEGPNFGGSLRDLTDARAACALPLLRKDFIVDPYQLHEAAAAGADAVLLIVAALEPTSLASLYEAARALGLGVVVEVHDGAELKIALALEPEVIGVNNRDLRDFSVDTTRTEQLMGEIPTGVLVVSESGISGPEQLERLHRAGVQAVLVGESLMRAKDPEAALRIFSDTGISL